ncbi:MAG: hypothetical protein D3M94_11095 [Rhodocyclales bacterium GT-UBC]|nr:MAG: hypothetical protein D3M94_11095 [Rhodocyclales bacterium GT-UBC]
MLHQGRQIVRRILVSAGWRGREHCREAAATAEILFAWVDIRGREYGVFRAAAMQQPEKVQILKRAECLVSSLLTQWFYRRDQRISAGIRPLGGTPVHRNQMVQTSAFLRLPDDGVELRAGEFSTGYRLTQMNSLNFPLDGPNGD